MMKNKTDLKRVFLIKKQREQVKSALVKASQSVSCSLFILQKKGGEK